ncbi:MAG: methyltransferase domain-containing protein [Alphaproteobacteria bacterium]|nr:methyltransferase domain-containing protein [Alphaproteobacteria bacterium]
MAASARPDKRAMPALKEQIRFLRGAIARPFAVGSIAPSSPALARAVAAQVDPSVPGKVLELGPGTGAVTQALIERGIQPARIIAIESDPDFAAGLAARFPGARIVTGDAFDFTATLARQVSEPYAAIVSGLPLLNHPKERRTALISAALTQLKPGAPYVQFSYGLDMPVPPPTGAIAGKAAFVWRNLPPARVYVYRSG